jgi:Ca-activated chloride channel homolog
MSNEQPTALLSIKGDDTSFGSAGLALQGVTVQGRLDGLLLRTTLQQCYRNTSGRLIETVYTFPLAHGATLLGLSVTLGKQRLDGAVIEKRQASRQYEQAIDDGDTPVLVDQSAPGLYTANLGNLQPGEEATIELEYAQLLRYEQGQVRLSIPTVVAPRYGDAHAQGGLAPHESVDADAQAGYPFTLTLDIAGPAATARLSSPTHAIAVQPQGDALRVTLARGAWLDRDFVLQLAGLEGQAFCVTAPDGDEANPQAQAVLASFCPRLAAQDVAPLRLKILVDCSGSMGGDSIAQARRALHEVGQWLTPADRLAYFRFGNSCKPVIPALEPCTPQLVARYAQAVSQTEADLGGTELHSALLEVYGASQSRDQSSARAADVLLITDGEVWKIDPIVQAARESGHRLFVVGVSSSPAESLLRALAEQSGGACELVTPNEDIAGAITRMVRRLHAACDIALRIDWGQTPLWQSPLPRQIFDGETLHVWARLKQPLQAAPTLHWSSENTTDQDQATQVQADARGTTARLAGARCAETLSHDMQKLALALRHQLVTHQTSLFLVHQRAEGEKAEGLPALQQIRQMMAAGHAGFGSVADSRMSQIMSCLQMPDQGRHQIQANYAASVPAALNMPTMMRLPENRHSAKYRARLASLNADLEIPVFLRTSPKASAARPAARQVQGCPSPVGLLQDFDAAVRQTTDAQVFLQELLDNPFDSAIAQLLQALVALSGSRETAAALLLAWLQPRLAQSFTLSRQADRVLRNRLRGLGTQQLNAAWRCIEACLERVSAERWEA